MENIGIETSQNITIEQTVASIGERIAAAAIDYLIFFIYYIFILIIGAVSHTALIFFLLLPVVLYHLICESVMNGQSWGKRIMKIKVVKIDGSQANFFTYLIRWIFRIVDVTICFGAISAIIIILNGKGQRLGDIVANTTVIRIRESSLNDTIYTILPEGYSLVFPQINRLSESDIYTAREVLDFLKDSDRYNESAELASKAKKALEAKMGIQSDLISRKFLLTIITDYNYYHSR
jgi:uncharacterized RDD family membrane protein YckC